MALTAPVVNAVALRTGGGLAGLLQLLPAIPADWVGATVVVDGSVAEQARRVAPPHVRIRPSSRSGLAGRLLEEHVSLPLGAWRRGARWWIGLGNVPPLCWPGRAVVLLQSAYSYTHVHDDGLDRPDRVLVRGQRTLLRLLRRRLAGAVLPSEVARDEARPLLRDLPTRVRHWGVAVGVTVDRPAWTPGSPLRLACVSTLYRHKDLRSVLRVLAVLRRGTDASLTIVGPEGEPGHLDELRSTAEALGIEEAVTFLGRLEPAAAHEVVTGADVYVLLSRLESFGMTWLEAQAAGTPVVAPDIPVAREVLGDGAWFVDPRDEESVARAVLEAAGRPAPVLAAARANAEAHDLVRTASAFWSACQELLDQPERRRRSKA